MIEKKRRLIRVRRKGIGLAFVMCLSMVAGMTDAIGLLMAGDFVSFMSGNTTRAAIAIGEGDFTYGAILLGAVASFIVGNAFGVVVGNCFRQRLPGLLGAVVLVLMIAALLPLEPHGTVSFYLVVLAMGMINASVEHIEGLPIGLTYVTGALSRFGRGIGRWLLGDRRREWSIQIVPWTGMFAGAIIGSLLSIRIGQHALWFAAGMTLLLAIVALLVPERLQARFRVPSHSPNVRRK